MFQSNFCTQLSDYGLIEISGVDAEKFLQGQLSCDLREVNDQQTRLGVHCDHKGRVQVTFRLFKFHENYYLRVLKNLIDPTLILLRKYSVFFKTKLENVTDQWIIIGLSGDVASDFFKKIAIKTPSEIDNGTLVEDGMIIRVRDEILRYEIFVKKNSHFYHSLCALPKNENANAWHFRDIISGVPTVYPETVGHFTPHQINYQYINGISFNKGCYTGQEIVARMQYLGKLKQHMYHVEIENIDEVRSGTKINNEEKQEVGEIVQTARDNSKLAALAVLNESAIDQTLTLDKSNKTILTILNLPYTVSE